MMPHQDDMQLYDLMPSDLSKNKLKITELPHLPLSYATAQFDLVLCSDFIFDSALLPEQMLAVVKELCRVGLEVRIFPLLNEAGKMNEALGPLMLLLQQKNYGVEVRSISGSSSRYQNALLRIWAQECCLPVS